MIRLPPKLSVWVYGACFYEFINSLNYLCNAMPQNFNYDKTLKRVCTLQNKLLIVLNNQQYMLHIP